MAKFFHGLTPAQHERLVKLQEESLEVAHIICKILRHGMFSFDPTDRSKGTNQDMLESEIKDVLKSLWALYENKDVRQDQIEELLVKSFLINKPEYLHHQDESK